MPPLPFLLLWLVALALVAGVVTQVSMAYARRRGLLDEAGRRRSHVGRVPRGGGIAVIAAVGGGAALLSGGQWVDGGLLLRLVAAIGLVAAVGWVDDHRPLSAWLRLAVHLLAAALFALPWLAEHGAVVVLLALLALAVAVNFWNFMDGIDGIASLQALFVAALLAHAFAAAGEPGLMLLTLALAAGCLGFLPFNLPRARIFLGDVGSGGIGFAIGALLLLAVERGVLDVWTALLLPLAFWLDAGLTLLARMLLGRRWYTAHREHLYQWLVRRGRSHLQVDLLYAAWNLLIVLPAYLLIRLGLVPALPVLIGAAGLGATVWWLGRQRLLREARLYGYR